MKEIYGKLREDDIPTLEKVVEVLKESGLHSGIHGTSLWNKKYKDVDLLAVSLDSLKGPNDFFTAVDRLKKEFGAAVLQQRGDAVIGLDYDIQIKNLTLHLSYVSLL